MTQKFTLRLMGKKRGMTQLFDEKGFLAVCTVIEVEPNVVTQIKTDEKDGYTALQLGFSQYKTKDPRTINNRVTKPLLGHFEKNEIAPRRHLLESRLESVEGYEVGQEIGVAAFEKTRFLDVKGVTIGKGFQGVMKKYNFAGGRATHGNSKYHRGIGSTGMRSTPGRCLPGGKRASQMGGIPQTTQNLEIIQVVPEKNLIIVRGPIPGPKGGVVALNAAKKMKNQTT